MQKNPLTGQEIMTALQIPPSIVVGNIKNAVKEAILNGEIPNNHDAAFRYMMSKKRNLLMSDLWVSNSYAKINLGLNVLERLSNGYHTIETASALLNGMIDFSETFVCYESYNE